MYRCSGKLTVKGIADAPRRFGIDGHFIFAMHGAVHWHHSLHGDKRVRIKETLLRIALRAIFARRTRSPQVSVSENRLNSQARRGNSDRQGMP